MKPLELIIWIYCGVNLITTSGIIVFFIVKFFKSKSKEKYRLTARIDDIEEEIFWIKNNLKRGKNDNRR